MTWRVTKILVTTDGSDAAFRAVEAARDIAVSHKAKVIGLFTYAYAGEQVGGTNVIEDLEKEIGRNALDRMQKFFAKARIPFKMRIDQGSAVDLIVQTARKEKVDLIVMGSRGRTLARRLTGSVTNAVVANAPCAVLSVPKKKA